MADPDVSIPHAFFRALFSEDWSAAQHLQAVYGFLMRQHADAAHPDAVEHIAQLTTDKLDPGVRDAWLFGYRFRDTPASGGEGVGHAGGE